jgi:hypothetical protein
LVVEDSLPIAAEMEDEMSEPKSEPKSEVPKEMLTPDSQAYTNKLISEAIKGVFAQLGPVFESIALTPEKIAQAEKIRRAPTDSEIAALAREQRERKLTQQEAADNRKNLLRNQANCPHKYPTGQWAVGVIRNYPDRRERFVCMLCQSLFEPSRWVIGPPDADNPRGKAYIEKEHPQYQLVREVLASKG